MSSNYVEFQLQLVDERLDTWINDDTGLFCVMQAGIPLKQTAYSDAQGTALTQPATMTDGVIRFFIDSGTTTVDLSVLTASGRSFFLEAVTTSQHRIPVNTSRDNYQLVGAWAILSAHVDGAVSAVFAPFSGGLPAGIRIKDVFVHITTLGAGVGAGLLVDFGVSGDSDGFIDGTSASATGYFLNVGDFTNATGAVGGMFVSGVQTRGVLLCDFGTGLLTATTAGVRGFIAKKPYMISLVTTTNNLVFAVNATSALTTVAGARGYVFYEYDVLPTAGN